MSGPYPKYQSLFPADFLEQARTEVRRKTAPYQSVQRYRLVLLLDQYPQISNEEAGRQVALSGTQ